MKLVYTQAPDRSARTGDVLTSKGEDFILQEVERPRHAGSPGRVYVTPAEDPDGTVLEFSPQAFGLQWVNAEVQA